MKPMNDRKMDMKRGEDDSFFPADAMMKVLPRAGEIMGFKYPDTEELVYADQQDSVEKTSRNLSKPDFRH